MKPSRSGVAIAVLSVALVASNLWWLYVAFDAGITATYRERVLEEHHQALVELLVAAPVAADPAATPGVVLNAARDVAESDFTFEKDGFTWVGHLGYRFDETGRLVEVQPTWSPF